VAVLLYQLTIIISLILTRFIAPKRLMAASLIWTVFTLVNLLWPPLIIIQLLVIWLTFYFIKPPGTVKPKPLSGGNHPPHAAPAAVKKATVAASPFQPQVKPAAQASPAASAARTVPAVANKPSLVQPKQTETLGILNSVTHFFNELDDRVSFQQAVQSATSPLLLACETERLYIERSLEDAQRRLERDSVMSADANMQTLYESNRARIEQLLHNGAAAKAPATIKCTDFRSFPVHADRNINQAIENKLNSAVDDYAAFLREAILRLETPGLKTLFEQGIRTMGGADLLNRIACFARPGVDWRSIAEIELWRKSINTAVPTAAAAASQPTGDIPAESTSRRIPATARVIPNLLNLPQYADQRSREAIRQAAVSKKIPLLAHFTRVSNLYSILEHGLCPLDKARASGITPHTNDPLRLDGYPGAVSVSIAFPNYKMFYKYRMLNPSESWVVVLLAPSILWQKKCGFCQYNAADRRILGRPLTTLTHIDAFHSMFTPAEDGPSRQEQQLNDYDPTDPQGEVLVFDGIEPTFIEGIAFENSEIQATFAEAIGTLKWKVYPPGSGPFGSRHYRGAWRG